MDHLPFVVDLDCVHPTTLLHFNVVTYYSNTRIDFVKFFSSTLCQFIFRGPICHSHVKDVRNNAVHNDFFPPI